MRSYAIGDIHGHIDLLTQAHEWIAADRARTGDHEAPVIHLGDLVDRGPDAPAVIEYLMQGQTSGKPWNVLRGNHDTMFALFPSGQTDPGLRADYDYLHPNIGGLVTLASYGVDCNPHRTKADIQADAARLVPLAHREFTLGLPFYQLRGEVLFVHAGVRPGVALTDQTETDLAWIRQPFHIYTRPHPWLVVHGHTPINEARHYGNRVNIDSGAAYGGPLTVVVIEGRSVFTLGANGRAPLVPHPD